MRRRCRQTALLLEAGLFFGEYSNVAEVGFQIKFEVIFPRQIEQKQVFNYNVFIRSLLVEAKICLGYDVRPT